MGAASISNFSRSFPFVSSLLISSAQHPFSGFLPISLKCCYSPKVTHLKIALATLVDPVEQFIDNHDSGYLGMAVELHV